MTSRRGFLVGGAAAITLPALDRFHNFLERHGEPLVEAPEQAVDTLTVREGHWNGGWAIGLNGDPLLEKAPFKNALEHIIDQGYFDPTDLSDSTMLEHEYGIRPEALLDPAPEDWDIDYLTFRGPVPRAFDRLAPLDLEQDGEIYGQRVGGLIFETGGMGSDYQGVHVEDLLSVSLLQHRLNQLGELLAVQIIA
jgi:hypothetical protein